MAGSGTPEDCTASFSLVPGAECNLSIRFEPTESGPLTGSVTLSDNALNGNPATQTISLSGIGENPNGPPLALVSPTYLAFGAIDFGTTKTRPLMVANLGGGTLTVAPSITGHSYTIAGSTCGAGVTSGNSCTLQVEFSPTSISTTHDDTLTVQTNGGNPTVDLHGAAIGLSVSSTQLKFGTISSGSTEVLPLTVTNVGLPGTVTVATAITVAGESIEGYSFEVLTTSENTCLAGIAAGQSCTLPVEFAPTMSGNHADLLTLTPSAGGGSTTVWLNGTTP